MVHKTIKVFEMERRLPGRVAAVGLRLCVSAVCYDALLRPSNWGLGGAERGRLPLMSGVHMRVGVVFVMHVHQLQVRPAVRSLLSLCFRWHLQRQSQSLVITGVGGWREVGCRREGHYAGRRRPPAIWTELPFITEELIPAYRKKWRRTL